MAIGYDFIAPLWQWKGDTPWHFITVPERISDEIAARMEGFARGFGSVRVRVRVGATEWATSVFPDSASGCYLLPIKKAVRAAEGLEVGAEARVHLELVDLRP